MNRLRNAAGRAAPAFCLILSLLLLLSACGAISELRLQGTWQGEIEVLGFTTKTEFLFNEDGSGSMTSALGIGIAMEYTLEDDQLTIVTKTPVLQTTLRYTIAFEGDVLHLIDEEGNETDLRRV